MCSKACMHLVTCCACMESAEFHTPLVLQWLLLVLCIKIPLYRDSGQTDSTRHPALPHLPHHTQPHVPQWVHASNSIINDVAIQWPLHPVLWIWIDDCRHQEHCSFTAGQQSKCKRVVAVSAISASRVNRLTNDHNPGFRHSAQRRAH